MDGADEIDPSLWMIKGGGGALLREKIVAGASSRVLIIADESKLVPQLGAFPLPVEISPFAWKTTIKGDATLFSLCSHFLLPLWLKRDTAFFMDAITPGARA